MTLNRDADLMYLLGACGSALHDELKKLSGASLVPQYPERLVATWMQPPLLVRASLLGVSLAEIPNLMFGHLVDNIDVEPTWLRLASAMCNESLTIPRLVTEIFPALPQNEMKPVNVMARVLAVMILKGGQISLPNRQIYAKIDGQDYGITSMAVVSPGTSRRLKRFAHLDTWTALNVVGHARRGDPRFRDLEGHVAAWAPKLLTPFRIVVSAAVHKGLAFQDQLLDCFEFDPLLPQLDTSGPWRLAREIVAGSTKSPVVELRDLLVPVIGNSLFLKKFGNPYVVSKRFTPRMRAKYSTSISDLEAYGLHGRGGSPPPLPEGHDEALALLKFQRSIGL